MNIPIVINSFACLVYAALSISAMFAGTHEDVMMVVTQAPVFFSLVSIFWLIYLIGMDK